MNKNFLKVMDCHFDIPSLLKFDAEWYLIHNMDVAKSGMNPREHYLRYGRREGRAPGPEVLTTRGLLAWCVSVWKRHKVVDDIRRSGLFASDWYSNRHQLAANIDPVVYYCEIGWERGNGPSPEFDVSRYAKEYGLVGDRAVNPVLDYLDSVRRGTPRRFYPDMTLCRQAGVDEARLCPDIRSGFVQLRECKLWDAEWYAGEYGFQADCAPWLTLHYLLTGWREGHLPSPEFEGNVYLRENPDVRDQNPLVHYLEIGMAEKRRKRVCKKCLTAERVAHLISTSPFFDAEFYRKFSPELNGEGLLDLAEHYRTEGWKLGWDASEEFKTEAYLDLNSDVRRAKICPLQHYLIYGQYEGRKYKCPVPDPQEVCRLECALELALSNRLSRRKDCRRLLLLTHEFSYTGAPLSLLKAAQCLRTAGYRLMVVSRKDGPLKNEFRKVAKVHICPTDVELVRLSMRCDVAIVNTMVLNHEYDLLRPYIPSVWWLREPAAMMEARPGIKRSLMTAETVYAMSDYSANAFAATNAAVGIIPHGMDDEYRGKHLDVSRPTFAVIGTIQERKGQDVFIEAIKRMDPDLRSKARFLIVGRALADRYEGLLREQAGGVVEFLGECTGHDEMMSLYESLTCAVIPSREEPTSRVAIEAMMMGRPVIMSDHVGARYLVNDENGRIFTSGDSDGLRACMEWMLQNPQSVSAMEQASRRAYLSHNAIDRYTANLLQMLQRTIENYQEGYGKLTRAFSTMKNALVQPCRPPSVSIVIPVYNAREEVEILLDTVATAISFNEAEVIIVDDCSKEETASFLRYEAERRGHVLLRNEVNSGFVKTCNRGMRAAKGDVVVLLNSDTMISPSFVSKIQDCFEADAAVACACPVAVHSGWFDLPISDKEHFLTVAKRLENREPSYPLFTPEGFCFCCRMSALRKVGLLDEAYGMGYSEEDDLVMRLLRNGYRTVLIDNLLVYHKRHASFSSERRKTLFESNRKIFNARYGNQQVFVRDRMHCQYTVDEISAAINELCTQAR